MKNKAVVKVMPPQGPSIASRMKDVLEMLGEDTSREGLVRTPERYEKAMRYLTSGYTTSLEEIVNNALFIVKVDSMVIVKDIEFFSMCEHHMLPFYGKVHVAYIARNKVIGLSKLPRIIDAYARRLQIQERLTQEVAQCIQDLLDPLGVDRPFAQRYLQRAHQLVAIERHPAAIALDDREFAQLHPFKGGEAEIAGDADPAPPDHGGILGRTRVLYLGIETIAAWAAHPAKPY